MKARVLLVALICALIPAVAAPQALTSLASVRVGYTTRKNTVKPQGELKAQIDALDAQIAEAGRLGQSGELRRLYAKGIALLGGPRMDRHAPNTPPRSCSAPIASSLIPDDRTPCVSSKSTRRRSTCARP